MREIPAENAENQATDEAGATVATVANATFRDRTLPQLRLAVTEFEASGSIKLSAQSTDDGGVAASDVTRAERAWNEFLHSKYDDADEAALEKARIDLEAIVEWQSRGPFETESDRLPKELLSVMMRELSWLQER